MCKYCDKVINYDHSKLKKVASEDCETIAATEDYLITSKERVKHSDPKVEELTMDIYLVRWQDKEVTLYINGDEDIDIKVNYCPFCGIKF